MLHNLRHSVTVNNFNGQQSESNDNSGSNDSEKFKVMETPDKSEKDRKEYRVLTLNNGIRALIISDPSSIDYRDLININNGAGEEDNENDSGAGDEDNEDNSGAGDEDNEDDNGAGDEDNKDDSGNSEADPDNGAAACCVCVDVGSFSDPPDIQGLAHFVEHMIFRGSKKYSDESSGGGETDCEETLFYFELLDYYLYDALDDGLDRFANYFKEPLMLKECMLLERENVESEFQSTKYDNATRSYQLLASLGNAGHPSSIFGWGNMKSLSENISDDELYRRAREFRERHYSAHRMFVCIQAHLPLDTIQLMLLKHFSDIPNNGMTGDDFSNYNHLNAFQDEFTDKIVVVKAVGSVTKLEVTFCLASSIRDYRTKAYDYIAELLGYEGKGSLASYLRKRNWALDLGAGIEKNGSVDNELYCLFNITIGLTQRGINNVKEVLESTFGYLKFMLSTLDPITTQTLYTEFQTKNLNNFRYLNEETSLDNVKSLVLNLKHYPPKDILTGPHLYFEYDYNAIHTSLEVLNRSKFNIMITTTATFEGHEFDKVEPWFETQYCLFDIPNDWMEKLKDPRILDDFTLPEPNIYIPNDLTILYNPGTLKLPQYPEKIMENEICEFWYRQDDKFLLPISNYNFYFTSPMAQGSIEKKVVVLLSLFTSLVEAKITEILYPAVLAGHSYSTHPGAKGLVLKVCGFSQNLHHLVEVFISNLTTFADEVTEQEFNMFVEEELKNYHNILTNPMTFAKSLRLCVIENECYPTYEKYDALKKVKFSDFQTFAAKFLRKLHIKGLFQGNLTLESAMDLATSVLNHLKPEPIDEIAPITTKTKCLIDLLLTIAEEPLLSSLSSKEQLGYDVSCCSHDDNGTLGYSITVNSQETNVSSDYVDERIEIFRSTLLNIIREASDNSFECYKESVMQNKLNRDDNLNDEICRNWTEITTNEYAFDRAAKEIECLKKITKSQFLDLYAEHLELTKKFSVQVIGTSDSKMTVTQSDYDYPASLFDKRFDQLNFIPMWKESGEGFVIQNIPDFVSTLELYPATKTNFDY